MDPTLATLWVLRLAFLALIYLFLFTVVRVLLRDMRAAAAGRPAGLGRLVVVGAPEGGPAIGTAYPLDAVTTIGRDVNNAIVVDDAFASAEHCLVTYRGRGWWVEDRGSTNGTLVNGSPVAAGGRLGYGDELQIGDVRFRLERGRPA